MSTDGRPIVDDAAVPGIAESGKSFASAAGDWISGLTELITLELRYSLRSAAAALIGALVLAAVLFSSWALVLATVAVILLNMGYPWLGVLVLINVVNLALALSIWMTMKRLMERIGLDATRHALGLDRAGNHGEPTRTDTEG